MKNNLTTVQQIYSCFGQGDIPGILEKLDDNVQWEGWADNSAQKAGVSWMQHRIGKEGVMAFFQTFGTEIKIKDFQVLSLMDGGNQIAAEFYIEADVVATGKSYHDEEMHLWTFNDAGKVIRLRHYLDTQKHIMASR
ncbi:MAG: nuclear transport factor 2 family protein [Saprospiraceae bacterium]|nr:nuclear transport factor 2 family protein [Saprospiraceae bacterium]MCF8248530.1 nuclear transport factor 2 family protein [Saprospiraceae bacterium]MCF8283067.1 nuclear transport factor 2 family protein [Bacteroidales bacterium]MCF8310264.1 nuclear transport factor 2 family protein [Saprospiraceae bacterium]MCF8439297.1 nuclear transport factor 2 family protein [Saprospiraceae bacterium]